MINSILVKLPKNALYSIFTLLVLLLFVFSIFFLLPELIFNIFKNAQESFNVILIFGYIVLSILVFLYYYFCRNKCNLFILPINFLILPFLLYYLLSTARNFFEINSCPAGWEIFAVIAGISYSLPYFIITLIVSIIMIVKKRKNVLDMFDNPVLTCSIFKINNTANK